MSAGLSGFSSRLGLGLLGLSIGFAVGNLSSFCHGGISVGGLKQRLRSYSAERFREPRSPSSYLSRMVRYVDTAFLFEASRRVLGGEWRANGTFLDAEFTSTFFFLGAEAFLGAAFVLCGIGCDVDFEPSNIPCSINSPKVSTCTIEFAKSRNASVVRGEVAIGQHVAVDAIRTKEIFS